MTEQAQMIGATLAPAMIVGKVSEGVGFYMTVVKKYCWVMAWHRLRHLT